MTTLDGPVRSTVSGFRTHELLILNALRGGNKLLTLV